MNLKKMRTTTEMNGHTHTYDESKSGKTSEVNGHSHDYNVDDNGYVTIGDAAGHTHQASVFNKNASQYDKKSVEYIRVPFEVKNLTEDDDFWYFQGYASTFGNIDRGDDVISRGAFVESLRNITPRVYWNHDGQQPPIGKSIESFEDEKGLFVRARMPKDDVFVSGRIMPQLKNGSIDSMSIGFNVIADRIENKESKRVRIIDKLVLWEYSLVNIPMNPDARVLGIKSFVPYQDLPISKNENGEPDIERAWNPVEATGRINKFFNITDQATSDYKKAFLWYDKENESNLTAYKIPIADIIDDKLVVAPRAIFAAAALIRGVRGGVNISREDRNGVIESINKYYKKMGMESPFEEGKSLVDTFNLFSHIKDCSDFLKNFGLTNKECTALISQIKKFQKQSDDDDYLKSLTEELKGLSATIRL
jgi:HK97 family phage prohead protease